MTDIVGRLKGYVATGMYPSNWIDEFQAAAAEIERLRAEVAAWRECAKFDVLMEGPKAMGWDRSALERCRKKYIEVKE